MWELAAFTQSSRAHLCQDCVCSNDPGLYFPWQSPQFFQGLGLVAGSAQV